jgi:hypothetical protein
VLPSDPEPLTPASREKLLSVLREQEEVAAQIVRDVGAGRHFFEKFGFEGIAELYRVLEFTAVLRYDVTVIFADYVSYEMTERSHVYSRFLILTLYESTKTYRRLLGKNLQKKLANDKAASEFLARARGAHKALSAVADEVAKRYGDIREGIAAHRDEEALAQLERLRSIGGEEVANVFERFTRALGELEHLLHDFLRVIKQAFELYLRQMILPVGGEANIALNVTEEHGSAVAVDLRDVAWISHNAAVAVVSEDGRVTALAPGHARVTFEHRSNAQIAGGVFVLVGAPENLQSLEESWQSLFRPRKANNVNPGTP